MNAKSMSTILLLAFVGVSIVYLGVQEFRPAAQPAVSASGDAPPSDSSPPADIGASSAAAAGEASSTGGAEAMHRVVVYYFHNTQRCSTCLKIENWAHKAVAAEFAGPLKRGEVEWRALNVEEPPNEHFATDYQLVASSLVIVDLHDGQQRAWSNMERVWELVHGDEGEFAEYVAAQVRAYLES